MRTNSVLTYILLGLEQAGWETKKIENINGSKIIDNPTETDKSKIFGINFEKTKIDRMMLEGEVEYNIKDGGIKVDTNKDSILIEFNPDRFRPVEVPILLAETTKIQKQGATIQYTLKDIIKDQLNYFIKKENRD